MKKLLALIFVIQYSFAQVSTLPHSIGIGQNTLSSIPFHINKNGEVARFQGTSPYVSFYDGINMNGYLQAINSTFEIGTKNFYDMNFYTGDASRININGTTGMATFYQKLIAQNGIKLTGPLQTQGESVGADGMVLVSKGNATPAWEDKRIGFQAYLANPINIPTNSETVLSQFGENFDYSNSFDSSSGEFTAPSNGLYAFHLNMYYSNNLSGPINDKPAVVKLYKNGIQFTQTNHSIDVLQFYGNNLNTSFFIKLNANDIIHFTAFHVTGISLSIPNVFNGNDKILTGYKIF